MERDINRQQAESIVRKITEERERFLSAWEQGARSGDLNQIRQKIQYLNDLLWEASAPGNELSEHSRAGGYHHDRESSSRTGPLNPG